MNKKDIIELRAKTEKELTQVLADFQMTLAKARMEKKAGKVQNTSSVGTIADDIARIKTILRERQLTATQQKKETE